MTHNSNFCPDFHKAVELIGRRWSGAIVRELLAGASRFSEVHDSVPDLSERMLCARLRELEVEGIVERRVHAEAPGRVEYLLTEKGRALEGVFAAIGAWADRWSVIPSGARERPAHECEHRASLAQPDDPSLRSG
ncbi:MAG: winged helix-turn-helix transcriptional regulator [Gemmatimonadales bacterium]